VYNYRKAVFLSPSVCTKRSILLGKETRPTLCINDAKLRSGIQDLEQNKHQLLHIIARIKTPLIYNIMTTLEAPKWGSLLTGGHCSDQHEALKRWLLWAGGRYS